MSQVIRTGVELAAAGGIGAVGGALLQDHTEGIAAAARNAFFSAYRYAGFNSDRAGFWRRLPSAEQALVLAASGIAVAGAIFPIPEGGEPVGPTVAIENLAFDYQVTNNNGNISTVDKPAHLQNAVAGTLLGNMHNFNLFAAYNNQVKSVTSVDQLDKIAPYGSPTTIQGAVGNVLAKSFIDAPLEKSNLLKKNAAKSGAILVFDDNSSIGVPSTVENAAAQDGGIPIYVANVGGSSNSATTTDLESITSVTGGKYWDLNSGDVNAVTKDIESTIHVNGNEGGPSGPDRIGYLTISALGVYAAVLINKKQRKSTVISS